MKNKLVLIGAAAILLIALIAGSISGYRFPDTADKEAEKDRLCGVYLTATHLDQTQEQMSADHIKIISDIEQDFMPNNESAKRWYAKRTDEGTSPEDAAFEFEVPGYAFFQVRVEDPQGAVSTLICDKIISGIRQHIQALDGYQSVHLEGEIYVIPGGAMELLYFNPVYQTPEGEVYMIPGSGLALASSLIYGSSLSQEINENYTETAKNGAGTASTTMEKGSSCKLTFYPKNRSEEICLIAFNEENEKISEEKIQQDDLPENLEVTEETAYLILEEISADRTERTMLTREDSFVRLFVPRDDGVFEGQDAQIEWK